MAFKDNLAYVIAARGYNQLEAAERVGLSPATISRLLRGENEPQKSTVRILSRGLECSIADLIGEDLPTHITKPAALRDQKELQKEVETAVKNDYIVGAYTNYPCSSTAGQEVEMQIRSTLQKIFLELACTYARGENVDLYTEFGKHIAKKYLGGKVDESKQV